MAITSHLASHGGHELRKAAPCPLCYTQLAARELRSLRIHPVEPVPVDSTLSLVLLRRPRDSIIPLPADKAAAGGGGGGGAASAANASARGAAGGRPPGEAAVRQPEAGSAAPWSPTSRAAAAAALSYAEERARAAELLPINRFAKFSTTSDPTPLWAEEAERLARYATQVSWQGRILETGSRQGSVLSR